MGDILIKKKYILPHELMKAVCMQVGLEYKEELNPTSIDTNIIKNIPINYAKSRGVLPIKKTEEEVIIVLEDELHQEIKIYKLEEEEVLLLQKSLQMREQIA